MQRLFRCWGGLVLAMVLLGGFGASAGCSSFIVHQMVEAPNKDVAIDPADDPSPSELRDLGVAQQFRLTVAQQVSLLVWVIEPAEDSFPQRGQPRGTLLALHGFRNDMSMMLPAARKLAADGYRVVLLDLPGRGRSSGQWISFGGVETADLSRLLDELQRLHLCDGRVGVVGFSYGGSLGIQLAAVDPRVKAVVALAPFASLRQELRFMIDVRMPFYGWMLSDAYVQQMVDDGAQRAGFDPDEGSPLQAIAKTRTPILLIHGTLDGVVSSNGSQALHAAAPDHSRLIELPMIGHYALAMTMGDVIEREAPAWFDTYLTAGAPAPVLK